MSYIVRSSSGVHQFRSFEAAVEAVRITGGTLHRILGKQGEKPVLGKELSLDKPKD